MIALILSKVVLVVIFLLATAQVSAPIDADLQSVSEPIAGVVLMLIAGFAPYMTYKAISFMGFDMYHAMSAEQEAKSALNRPMPIPHEPATRGPSRARSLTAAGLRVAAVAAHTAAAPSAAGAGVGTDRRLEAVHQRAEAVPRRGRRSCGRWRWSRGRRPAPEPRDRCARSRGRAVSRPTAASQCSAAVGAPTPPHFADLSRRRTLRELTEHEHREHLVRATTSSRQSSSPG